MMIKWLRDSGMSVNESKTEVCLFHKNNVNTIDVTINNVTIRSKTSIKKSFIKLAYYLSK